MEFSEDRHLANAADYVILSLKSGKRMDDVQRAPIHALTRKVTMSDEELAAALQTITDRPDVLAFVLDLRDRYEEQGKYAPDPTR